MFKKKEEMEITYNLTHLRKTHCLTFYYISIWFCFWGVAYNFDKNYTLQHMLRALFFICPMPRSLVSVNILFQHYFRSG